MTTLREMKEPVVLAIDMDGVLVQWYEAIYEKLEKKLSGNWMVHPKDMVEFYLEDKYTEEQIDAMNEVRSAAGFYAGLSPVPGAFTALKMIEDDDRFDAYICTAPDMFNPTCASEKIESISRLFGDYWAKRFVIAPDKTRCIADFLIDDKGDIHWRSHHGPVWKQILFSQPHNNKYQQTGLRDRYYSIMNDWEDWPVFREKLVSTKRRNAV